MCLTFCKTLHEMEGTLSSLCIITQWPWHSVKKGHGWLADEIVHQLDMVRIKVSLFFWEFFGCSI